MPSIRRSLIVYFLILLALALSGMALLADNVTANALAEKETAAVQLIDRTAADKEQEERDKFDAELLTQARDTARIATSEYAVHVEHINGRVGAVYQAAVFGSVPALPGPGGLLNLYASAQVIQPNAPSQRWWWRSGPLAWMLYQANQVMYAAEMKYGNYLTHQLDDDHPNAPLIQLNGTQRQVWKSSRLPDDGLPFDREEWEQEKTHKYGDDWRHDTLDLPSGPVRRVVYKPNTGGYRFGGGPPRPEPRPEPGRGNSGRGDSGRPDQGRGESRPEPGRGDSRPSGPPRDLGPGSVSYFHVARPTTELEADVARIHLEADERKAVVRESSAHTRRTVQLLLGVGSVIAFIGLLVGGWVLVSVGLRPLRKLTDAVSRVSEKDFHLPVAANELSHELVPIHDRLAQSLSELKAAFEREKQAVADISHELRTPVASLLATIDVTLRKPRTADQYKQALEDCRQLTKQLGGLVERVMTLAYLDAGQTQVNATDTDPVELASGCAAVIRPLAESHGLTLTTDLQPTTTVNTDPDKLREVMINLLHNAVEYNRPGGSVRLAVRREANGGSSPGPVVVEVSDTGIGMTADVRGKIFERFYRADASRTATGVHAGLGLAIVKEYVDRLGGTISVESEQDRGSTFRVTLPG
jgi:signal transduction histidine kinase